MSYNNLNNYKSKYLKYKIKYMQLKGIINTQRTEIDKISAIDFSKNMEGPFKDQIDPMLCNGLVQFTKIVLLLFDKYPPSEVSYIFLGQSPVILNIISEVIAQYKGITFNYRGLPISKADIPLSGINEAGRENIYNFFSDFQINTLTGKCIVIDYVESGLSLSNIAELLSDYIKKNSLEIDLKAVGISASGELSHSEVKKFPIDIIYMKPTVKDSEEDAGLRIMTRKTDLDILRLYKKIKLRQIAEGEKPVETYAITAWLKNNLSNVIMIVKSILEGKTDFCNKLPKKHVEQTEISDKGKFHRLDMMSSVNKYKMNKGEITLEEYKSKIESMLKRMVESSRITEKEATEKLRELLTDTL